MVGAALVAVVALVAGVTALSGPAGAAVSGQWWIAKYQIAPANQVSTGAGVTVAVVDSGVVATLGDLRGQVLSGRSVVGGNPQSDPGEGCNEPGGCYSHGTQMALLIAGTGRGMGFQGVAPGAKILPVKVSAATSEQDNISSSDVAAGIRYAVSAGAKIISVSLGATGSCDAGEGAAIADAYRHDVITVAATGNDGTAGVGTPADCPGALAVGGNAENNEPWGQSNYGPQVVFTQAYGGVQESLSQQPLTGAHGTSDATALAAGGFALLRAKFPNDSARQIVARALAHTFSSVGAGQRQDDHAGYGVFTPYSALTKSTASNAANPVYDAFDKDLGSGSSTPPNSSPPGSTEPSSSSPGSSGSTPPTRGSAPDGTPVASSGSSSGGHAGVLIGLVVLVLLVAALAVWLIARSRRPKVAAGPYGPPPGGPYQGPPPGQGPPNQGGPYGGPPRR